MSATDDDLNAIAASLEDYDAIGCYLLDPMEEHDEDDVVLAPGGDPVAITMGAAGAAGPEPSLHPATPGKPYSSVATFELTGDEPARYLGVFVGGELRRSVALKTPIGPGIFPVVYAPQIA